MRWVIAFTVTTLLVALAGGLVAAASPAKFVSKPTVLVGPVTADVDTLRASESLTSTFSQLLTSPAALQRAARVVGMSPKEVSDSSVVTFNTDTRIITLTVTTATSSTTRGIASSLTNQLAREVGTVDPTAPGAITILSVQPQTAQEVRPSVARYALLAGAGWLLLAAAVLAAFASRSGSSNREPTPVEPRPATSRPRRPVRSGPAHPEPAPAGSPDERDGLRL